MNEIREIRQALEDVRYERIVFRADLAFRKFMRAVKAPVFELNIIRGPSRKYYPTSWTTAGRQLTRPARLFRGRL